MSQESVQLGQKNSVENLISAKELIHLLQNSGVKFGKTDPSRRLRYYVKLGLIPKPAKRLDPTKSYDKTKPPPTTSYYPSWVKDKLIEIEKDKDIGISAQKQRTKISQQQDQLIPERVSIPVLPNVFPAILPLGYNTSLNPSIEESGFPHLSNNQSVVTAQNSRWSFNQKAGSILSGSLLIPGLPAFLLLLLLFLNPFYSNPTTLSITDSALRSSESFILSFSRNQSRTSDNIADKSLLEKAGEVLARTTAPYLKIGVETEITELLNAFGGIVTEGGNANLGSGELTASNVIYDVLAGENVTVSGGQTPTISVPNAGAGIESVTGTSVRITSSGGTNPQIDIASNYAGQTSVNTLGTITTGTWNGSPLTDPFVDDSITAINYLPLSGGTLTSSLTLNNDDGLSSDVNLVLGDINESGDVVFNNSGFTGTLTSGALGAGQVWTLPDETGTICTSGTGCGASGALFDVTDGTTTETINATDTLIFSSGNGVAPTVSAVDTVTFDLGDLTANWVQAGAFDIITSGGITTAGTLDINGDLAWGGATVTEDLDMNSNLITSIGDAGTNFTAGGALTLAGALTVNSVGDSYIAGNLGIGQVAPSEELEITGDIALTEGANRRIYVTANSVPDTNGYDLSIEAGQAGAVLPDGGMGGNLLLDPGVRTRVGAPDGYVLLGTVNSAFVGIGDSVPSTKLALSGTGSINGITFGDDAANPANLYRGTTDQLNTDDALDVAGHGAFGGSASVGSTTLLNISETVSALGGIGISLTPTFNPPSNTIMRSLYNVPEFNPTGGLLQQAYVEYNRLQVGGSATVFNAATEFIETPSVGGSTVGNLYGIYVANQTGATSNYGIYVADAGTASLWLGSDDTDAASGISFGSTRDTTLYRSASNTLIAPNLNLNNNIITNIGTANTDFTSAGGLTLDDTLTISGSVTTGVNVQSVNGGSVTTGVKVGGDYVTDITTGFKYQLFDAGIFAPSAVGTDAYLAYVISQLTGATSLTNGFHLSVENSAGGGSATVSNGILIETVTGGAITDAIDISSTGITNGINLGTNKILASGSFTIDLANAAATTLTITNSNQGQTDITLTGAYRSNLGGAGYFITDNETLYLFGDNDNNSATATNFIMRDNGLFGTSVFEGSTTTLLLNLDNTQRGQRVCHSGADAATGVVNVGDCSAGGADFAEYYGVLDNAEAGDLVIIAPGTKQVTTKSGSNSLAYVKKSTSPYQPSLIGVISTNPGGEVLGDEVLHLLQNPKPVALAGRVPIKVSTENGPINIGDPLTSSSIPGVAMKATESGPIIGKALQSFSGSGVGKIVAFINGGWYVDPISAQGSQTALGSNPTFETITTNNIAIGENTFSLGLDGSIEFAGDINISGRLFASEIVTDQLTISDESSGSDTISAGNNTKTIDNNNVNENSKVVVTFNSDYYPANRYWVEKLEGGFVVHLDQAVGSTASLDWFVIN